MSLNILFSASNERWSEYKDALHTAFAASGVSAHLSTEIAESEVDYIIYAPNGPVSDFSIFPQLKAVLGLWAGVETVVDNPTLKVPMSRMVDSGLREGMVEWVTGHVLRYHLGMDAHITGQNGVWKPEYPPLARHRKVGILGMGALGSACAKTLATLNFQVCGWSRTPKEIAGVNCYSGEPGLEEVLAQSEILVLLLPLTQATENILNTRRLAMMPKGAKLLNPGRGALIDDDAMLEALNAGHIGHATLDTFRVEPLPADHPYWTHKRVTVTPHLASETRADTSAEVIAENIRRFEAGEEMSFVVDRVAGY